MIAFLSGSALFLRPDSYPLALVIFLLLGTLIIARVSIKKFVLKEREKFQLEKNWYEQENKVLKAQMDPHFIFNSLNTIQQFIIANENEKAQLYLSTFSQLIRMQLETNTNENIYLRQEIEILEKYPEIESLRFNNMFDHKILIGDNIDLVNTSIPCFLIQPFVENAIHHGLLPKLGEKALTITFEMPSEGSLLCIIEDNGIGRKNSLKRKVPFKTKSLGVNFVEQRLLVISKIEKHSFSVTIIDKENEEGHSIGTKAIISLPNFKK